MAGDEVAAWRLFGMVASVSFCSAFGLWFAFMRSPQMRVMEVVLVSASIVIAAILLGITSFMLLATDAFVESVAGGVYLTIFITFVLGPILLPIGIGTGLLVHRWQRPRQESPSESAVISPATQHTERSFFNFFTTRWFKRLVLIFLGGSAAMVAMTFYLLFFAGDVRVSAHSPSGEQALETYEACFGHACEHRIEVIKRQGDADVHYRCSYLGFTADYPVFEGAEFSWSTDERSIRWQTKHGFSGELNVASDCEKIDAN